MYQRQTAKNAKKSIITAVLFLQAVFLLLPASIALAQTPLLGTTTQTVDPGSLLATSTPFNYQVSFYMAPSYLATSSRIFAQTNFPADEVRFFIQQNTAYFGGELQPDSGASSYKYSFRWDLTGVANGTYQLSVQALKNGQFYYAPAISVTVTKPYTEIDLGKTATSTQPIATTTLVKQPASIKLVQPISSSDVFGTVKIIAETYGPIRRVEIQVLKDGFAKPLGFAVLSATGNRWELDWMTETLTNGQYSLLAHAWDDKEIKIAGSKITVNVTKPLIEDRPIASNTPPVASSTKTTAASTTEQISTSETSGRPPADTAVKDTAQTTSATAADAAYGGQLLAEEPAPVDARCEAIGISDSLKCSTVLSGLDKVVEIGKLTSEKELPKECQNAGITAIRACELFMRTEYLTLECGQAGVTSKSECVALTQSRFGRPAACSGYSDLLCSRLVGKLILADYVDQTTMKEASEEIKKLAGKHMRISPGAKDIPASIRQILPFRPESDMKFLVLSSSAGAEKSKTVVAGALLLDSDADGLTDDLEIRLGTDKQNPDSDGDGYQDGAEVKSGHNPNGTGNLQKTLEPIEQAIVNKSSLEQPKLSGVTKNDLLKITKINNAAAASGAGRQNERQMNISGWALPNQIVTVYIYSVLPIVVTVATDQNGNWTYELDKNLMDGRHEAYVVINDTDGRIKAKSAPFSFFIKEARAVSQDEFLGADFNVPDRTNQLTGWYVAASLLLVLLGIGMYFLYNRIRSKGNINLN